jgi:hypothetical protein
MIKKFSYALIAVFLAIQIFSAMHMAEHGFQKHDHNGHLCSIFTYSEQSHSTNLPTLFALNLPVSDIVAQPVNAPLLIRDVQEGNTWPRAPPASSIS